MVDSGKFQRCMVMAGGGFRFGCYLGMHAAAEEIGQAPDVLLGACGGAIAASVIHALPDTAARYAWLTSPELYAFQCGIRSTVHAQALQVVAATVKRAIFHALARPGIANLHDELSRGMFRLPDRPVLPAARGTGPAVAIVGARIIAAEGELPFARLQETVFGSQRVSDLLYGQKSWAEALSNTTIAPELACNTTIDNETAVRISIADPYYLAAVEAQGARWSGGLVDLFPIEVARALAQQVVMERKRPFNALYAEPAVHAVYRVGGNARRRSVHAQAADVWIDTTDVAKTLRQQTLRKALDVGTGRIELLAETSYGDFVEHMDAQWHYGRERALRAFEAQGFGA